MRVHVRVIAVAGVAAVTRVRRGEMESGSAIEAAVSPPPVTAPVKERAAGGVCTKAEGELVRGASVTNTSVELSVPHAMERSSFGEGGDGRRREMDAEE